MSLLTSEMTVRGRPADFPFTFDRAPDRAPTAGASGSRTAERAARAFVAARIVGRCVGELGSRATFADVADWFDPAGRRDRSGVIDPASAAAAVLERVPHDDSLLTLLPYVLEPDRGGSRLDVLRKKDGAAEARRAKKASGVYYTPADVADYIVGECLGGPVRSNGATRPPRVLDPACGTGVFLRTALRRLVRENPAADRHALAAGSLFGIDIDPLATDAATFVLLADCGLGSAAASPRELWDGLRRNLAVADALAIDGPDRPGTVRGRRSLFGRRDGLAEIFPPLETGADVIVGNPPYATAGERHDGRELERRYATWRAGGSKLANLYPIFLVMMCRWVRPGGRGGLVVPLSIAYGRGRQLRACRRALTELGGTTRFAFFDREPHGLFWEEVKVRCAIVLRDEPARPERAGAAAAVSTGPLRRWHGRDRGELFGDIRFTPIGRREIVEGVPKIDGPAEAGLLARVEDARAGRLLSGAAVGACPPAEAAARSEPRRVFVSATAYNFLNVFPTHGALPAIARWSASPLHMLTFRDRREAGAAYAVLASRLTFWLWRVRADGFHVTRGFLHELPFATSRVTPEDLDRLAKLGRRLRGETRPRRFVSVNGGRSTVGYRPPVGGGVINVSTTCCSQSWERTRRSPPDSRTTAAPPRRPTVWGETPPARHPRRRSHRDAEHDLRRRSGEEPRHQGGMA